MGFDNWRKAVEATDLKLPLLIENTAGGDNAMTRYLERIGRRLGRDRRLRAGPTRSASASTPATPTPAATRWRPSSTTSARSPAGSTWSTATTAATSSTPAPTGTPTSAPARIDPDLLAAVVRDAGAPVVCETPGGADEHVADFAWLRERL